MAVIPMIRLGDFNEGHRGGGIKARYSRSRDEGADLLVRESERSPRGQFPESAGENRYEISSSRPGAPRSPVRRVSRKCHLPQSSSVG